jgi:hypothetical protein
MSIIYKTTNLINGRIYVGKHHLINSSYLGSGLLLDKAVKKYGKNNFKRDILEICSKEDVDEREIYWIKKLKATVRGIGYNLTKGGTGGDTFTNNPNKESTREKLRKISTGKKHTEEAKKKISILRSGSGNGMFGKIAINRGISPSEITRAKLSSANKGKGKGIKRSEEIRRKISVSRTGIVHSAIHKQKISRTLLGRKLSKITVLRMSIARKGIPQKKLKCPHCGKEGGTTMHRWHFEHCKYKG